MNTRRSSITAAVMLGLASIGLFGGVSPTQVAHAATYPATATAPGTTQGDVAAGARAPGRAKGHPDCSGVKPAKPDPQYLCEDWRLGPAELPTTGTVANLLRGYDRLAGMTPQKFLTTYWIGDAQTGSSGHWDYPPDNGFVKGKFVRFNVPVGVHLSRFGDPSGNFLALANSPFTKRALPPSALDPSRNPGSRCANNFHLYTVKKPLPGEEGVIAPAFGQPGLGLQYYLPTDPNHRDDPSKAASVADLVAQGYLTPSIC